MSGRGRCMEAVGLLFGLVGFFLLLASFPGNSWVRLNVPWYAGSDIYGESKYGLFQMCLGTATNKAAYQEFFKYEFVDECVLHSYQAFKPFSPNNGYDIGRLRERNVGAVSMLALSLAIVVICFLYQVVHYFPAKPCQKDRPNVLHMKLAMGTVIATCTDVIGLSLFTVSQQIGIDLLPWGSETSYGWSFALAWVSPVCLLVSSIIYFYLALAESNPDQQGKKNQLPMRYAEEYYGRGFESESEINESVT